jgi:hypothetical protein
MAAEAREAQWRDVFLAHVFQRSGSANHTPPRRVIHEMILPCAEPASFFDAFYSDTSAWGPLQHAERGDSDVVVGLWTGVPGTDVDVRSRTRQFSSPFETTLLSGVALVHETQYVTIAEDAKRLSIATTVAMRGDVPYCECYKVNTLMDVETAAGDGGVFVRVRMEPVFHDWTMWESRIREMVYMHGAESWEAWEEKAIKYLGGARPPQLVRVRACGCLPLDAQMRYERSSGASSSPRHACSLVRQSVRPDHPWGYALHLGECCCDDATGAAVSAPAAPAAAAAAGPTNVNARDACSPPDGPAPTGPAAAHGHSERPTSPDSDDDTIPLFGLGRMFKEVVATISQVAADEIALFQQEHAALQFACGDGGRADPAMATSPFASSCITRAQPERALPRSELSPAASAPKVHRGTPVLLPPSACAKYHDKLDPCVESGEARCEHAAHWPQSDKTNEPSWEFVEMTAAVMSKTCLVDTREDTGWTVVFPETS